MEETKTSHDDNSSKSEPTQGDNNTAFPKLLVSHSPNSGGSTADLLVKAMDENDLDEMRRLLNSKVDLLAMPIATKIIHDNEEIILNLAPLQWDAAFSEPSIINLLLEHGAKVDENIPTIGGTALHLASRFGSENNIDVFLSQKLDVNQKDRDGMTPLHFSSRYGREENVECLVDASADFRLQVHCAGRRFHYAARFGHLKTLQLLYERGSHIYVNEADGFFNAPLHLVSANGHVNVAKWLLQKGAAINQAGTAGDTPLLLATSREHVETVRELLNMRADVHKRNDDSYSSILVAFENTHLEIFDILRISGASLSGTGGRDNGTCYHRVISCFREFSSDHNKIIDRLHNVDTATENSHGMTALAYAVLSNHLEHVKLLIKNDANVICHDRQGITPLRIAILQKKNIAIVLEILAAEQYYPKSPSSKYPYIKITSVLREIEIVLLQGLESSKYETLEQLHIIMYWAVSNGAKDLANRCIDHDRQVLRWTREGATWLHIASKGGMVEIAQLLLGIMIMQSDSPNQPLGWAAAALIIQQNSRGDSPLAIAIEKGHDKFDNLLWSKIEQFQITEKRLIESYPDISNQILEFLARHEVPGNEEILKCFLRSGDKSNTKDLEDFTALQWAVFRSQAVVVWWLLSKGGYSSDEIKSALKLIVGNTDKQSEVIKALLRTPPLALDHVLTRNKKHTCKFPKFPNSAKSNRFMNHQGLIVDILSSQESIVCAISSVRELIYNSGPDHIIREFGNLFEHGLALLKKPLINDYGASPNRIGVQTKDPSSLDSTSPNMKVFVMKNLRATTGVISLMSDGFIFLSMSRLSSDSGRSEKEHMAIMKHFNKSWAELAAGAERCYMKPKFVIEVRAYYLCFRSASRKLATTIQSMILMAAKHQETPPPALARHFIKGEKSSTTKVSTVLDEPIDERDSRAIKHMPMTLYQYYYPTIYDTLERDNDQLLSKFLQKKSEQSRDREPSESLLPNPLNEILHDDIKNQYEHAGTAHSLVEHFLGIASGLFMKRFVPVSDQIYKGRIEIFRESIRDVAEKEPSLFREFLRGLQEAKPREQKSLEPEQKKKQPSSEDSDSKSLDKPMPSNRYHVISSETELLSMIRDIRDELHMLRSLAEDQEIVWKQVFASSDLIHFKAYSPTNVKKDLNAMLSEANKMEVYVSEMQKIV
ncbi:hypothetical protein BOTNAR_0766g00030 [Botryotinia narcissicola]|uniref:Uncharacterized protein n=1 Tax=Botryotinia narcissicola TaxID=278944 RepID=A0A4Z1H798_9HELO|nr:hypothetical protein BOTNAR_0766g00030 [Botryotinia narcissicola]